MDPQGEKAEVKMKSRNKLAGGLGRIVEEIIAIADWKQRERERCLKPGEGYSTNLPLEHPESFRIATNYIP